MPLITSTPARTAAGAGSAWFAGWHARGLVEVSDDPAVLDRGGWWAVMITFEGKYRFWRFAHVEAAELPDGPGPGPAWTGPVGTWSSSLDREAYLAGVVEIRRRIHEGDVYQVNLCRVLSADLSAVPDRGRNDSPDSPDHGPDNSPDHGSDADPGLSPWALARRLAAGNPAPYAGVIDVPARDGFERTRLVCASPELFLEREGDLVRSGPIKGTGATAADLKPKDDAENVMIVDLVRNDLQRVSRPGSVAVPALLQVEQHPGLVHLVSVVQSRLRAGVGWADLLAATLPPGSVSGAPKSTALRAIADLEPVPRGPYCGAVGFVDADRGRARLAVGIRTFWWQHGALCFGTGAGITWGSDPEGEWAETELKADRLIGLASDHRGPVVQGPGSDEPGDQVSSRATAASRSR